MTRFVSITFFRKNKMDMGYVPDLERGVVGISIPTLKRLCTALHIASDQILFPRQRENDVSAIAERCRWMPEAQLNILSDIVNKFIEAIHLAEEGRNPQ